MKKTTLLSLLAGLLLATATNVSAWWGGGWNPYDIWDPRYWIEEFFGGGWGYGGPWGGYGYPYYGGYGYGPWGYGGPWGGYGYPYYGGYGYRPWGYAGGWPYHAGWAYAPQLVAAAPATSSASD